MCKFIRFAGFFFPLANLIWFGLAKGLHWEGVYMV